MSFLRIHDDGGFEKLSGTIRRESTPWGAVWTAEEINSATFGTSAVAARTGEFCRNRDWGTVSLLTTAAISAAPFIDKPVLDWAVARR
jgi:hypothetical protein